MDARNSTTRFSFKRTLESACNVERRWLLATAAASLWLLKHNFVLAQSDTKNATLEDEYEQLLHGLASDEAALKDARGQRERHALASELGMDSLAASVDRAFPPSSTQISQRATDLIIYFEVSGEAAYRKLYKHPEWPGEQSGVTVGIGYDLGYASKETFKAEWQDFIDKEIIEKLSVACRVKGAPAAELAKSLRGVEIDWPAAFNQYTSKTQPIYVGETEGSLPNTDLLSADSLGALVSLVYNRGSPFDLRTDRFAEMRNIKSYMRAKQFDQIPNAIRSMKRLWPNSRGLRDRREAEAKLFAIGLKSNTVAARGPSNVSGNSPSTAPGGASGSGPSAAVNTGANTPGTAPSGAPSTPGSGPSVAPNTAPSGTSSAPVGGPSVVPSGAPSVGGSSSGPSATASAVGKTRSRMEIVLTNGRVLRVGVDIDPQVLARLVAVLDR